MKAVIMAGGKGTRLRPLTCNIPKPMVPLLDRPVMEYAIEHLKRHGITEIAVTVHHLPEVIRHYFGDGSEFGVRLHYFEEDIPLGTAGSVKNAEKFLDETFLVVSGDSLTDFDLQAAADYHRAKGAISTLVLASVEVPLEFGVVMTDQAGRVIRFLEKPGWSEVFSDTVNSGIYIMEPEVFRYIDKGVEFDFSKDLFPMLLGLKQPLYGYRAQGYWSDIGNLCQYRKTQFDMLERKVNVSIRGTEILPGVWVGEGVRAGRGIGFGGPSFIGRDCVIDDGVQIGEYSIIGAGSLIKQEASLERAVIWQHSVVEPFAEIKGATLCRRTVVGTGAQLLEGAVVGDGSQIGVKSFVQPGMKVWPGKTVNHHTRLNHSLIWEEQNRKTLFGQWGIRGSCHGELTPTFATKLTLSFGSVLPQGGTVGIGHDGSPYAALLAEALAAGIHASGLNTHDFGPAISAVSRHAVHHGDYAAGIHVRRLSGQPDEYLMELMDAKGLQLDQGTVRKVEQVFVQEDYRCTRPDLVGRRMSSPDVQSRYLAHLLRITDADTIRSMGFTVVIHCDYRSHQGIIPELLEALGCHVVQIADNQTAPDVLSRIVELTGADFGVTLDANGLLADLAAEDGSPVEEERLGVLQILMQLQEEEGALYVPVHLPGIVEGLGMAYNREVIRTKTDVRSVMQGCEREGFHIRFDGVYMLVRLMEYMSLEGKSLSELMKRVPVFALSKRSVDCPWQDKGKVMRCLMEEMKGKQVEFIDGIKVFHEDGWTLILPDSDEPIFRVVANARSPQRAEALAGVYARKIEKYRRSTPAS